MYQQRINMELNLFLKMLSDKSASNLKKMKYKYPDSFDEYIKNLKKLYYTSVELPDFSGKNLVYLKDHSDIKLAPVKSLLKKNNEPYGINNAMEEVIASNAIESIDFDRNSVRNIFKGLAPKDEIEDRILGQKKGLEFIGDVSNKITENNLYKLYMMTVGNYLDDENRLKGRNHYRHAPVYVVGETVEHTGLAYEKVKEYMKSLIEFANKEDDIHDLVKASIIHFFIAYVHPYFDGNGRMARLVHLWYLVQKGYSSALFLPFSSLIYRDKNKYYNAFTLVEENQKYNGVIDVTPFVKYCIENIYNKLPEEDKVENLFEKYENAVKSGAVTDKEEKLWKFVISYYGSNEFSTKQLEKDFGNAAYATIRSFVLKFTELELLSSRSLGNRVKYKIK